jgi:hypothetical protein
VLGGNSILLISLGSIFKSYFTIRELLRVGFFFGAKKLKERLISSSFEFLPSFLPSLIGTNLALGE